CMVNYTYKFIMAIVLTPLIYAAEKIIDNYLGHETAHKMKMAAMGQPTDGFDNIPTAG
ncbi:MAG: hypothetical protein H7178_04620, partial [Chitinophagaceae bacterium]|nr:hypothetical protein [Chitinophagaceae bacterium]